MDNQEMKLLLNKARVIDELEGSMPRWVGGRVGCVWWWVACQR